jgi:ABC-type Mn2+/Zn2+ transport system ATPase subunit
MKIVQLIVRQAGPLKEVKIAFTDKDRPIDIVLVAGANGTGKTTIMELIINMFIMLHPSYKITDSNACILNRTEFCQLDLEYDGSIISLVYGKGKPIIEKSFKYKQVIYGRYKEDKSKPGPLTYTKDIPKVIEKLREEIKQNENKELKFTVKSIDAPNVIYFPFYRYIKYEQPKQLEKSETLYSFLFYYGSSISQYEPPIAQKYIKKYKDINYYLVWLEYSDKSEYKAVKDFINNTVFTDKKLSKINRSELKAYIKTEAGDEHSIEYLSSGEQNLLFLALELRRRINKNSIILIDEIENSLHIEYQHLIMDIIKGLQKELGCQFIITSHSKEIKERFDDNNVLMLTQF